MGVTKLWQLLEERGEGEETPLSQCSGQSWAVDLSGWILHARTAAASIVGYSANSTMINTVFYRALSLLKHGIRPVFVMDGRRAPEVKSQTMQGRSDRLPSRSKMAPTDRSGLLPLNRMCQEMLESLGLQVISSSGEAEKTCALLNQQGIVDACLSDDSDSLLYGAKTVYRNLDVKKETVKKHTSRGIEEKLSLKRGDLVVMALLSGCDYGVGVKGIGPKKVLQLITAVKKYSSDVLQRVCSWRDNKDLDSIEQEMQRKLTKSTHCTYCQHAGSKVQHRKSGCTICGSTTECLADSGRECTCGYHVAKQGTSPYGVELDIRQKAVQLDSFPDQKLVDEFLDDERTFSISKVEVTLARWNDLVAKVNMTHLEVMSKLIPVLVHMQLYGILVLPESAPDSIVKDCKRNFVPCYLVAWKRFAFDKWTPEAVVVSEKTPSKDQAANDPYTVAVPCKLLEDKYPRLVDSYKHSVGEKKGKGKRVREDTSQGKLSDFFKVVKAKKVLDFEDHGQQKT
ncbi:hypothetical protein ACOMHN_050819 [Nucella lapillus]